MSFHQEQLQPNEEVVLDVNQHWIILIRPFVGAIFWTLVFGVIAFALVYRLRWNWGAYLLLLLIPIYVRFFWRLMVRAHEEYIITNLRIVKQQGVFSKSSFDSSLEKVNNVFHNQTFMGRMLGYGNVGLETASEQGTTIFRNIPRPVQFKNAIITQQQAMRSRPVYVNAPPVTNDSSSMEDVPKLLQQLGQLRDQGVLTPEEFETKKRELLSKL